MPSKVVLAALLLALVSPLSHAADAAAGKTAYVICTTCHGANGEGNAALSAPAIAGQEAWYVERQLKNYKTGIRGTHSKDTFGMQMRPMAMTLASDLAVANVAAYIENLPPTAITHTTSGDATKGKTGYMVCATCHGANGKGLAAMNAPNLTIQQDWYIARQIANYKSGARGSDPKDIFGMQMKPMAGVLATDAAINDVLAYIKSLK